MEFYRYENWSVWTGEYTSAENIAEQIFYLVKETPCGYWIHDDKFYHEHKKMHPEWHLGNKPFWVSKTSRKRYAYPTKEEALKGFIARKRREISILTARLRKAEAALKLAEGGDVTKQMSIEPIRLGSLSNYFGG